MKEKRLAGAALYHIIIFAIGIIMVYPLIWMVMSSFKETNTIFTTASSLIPEHFVTDNYANGWKGFAKISFSTFFKNSIFISVIATIGTIASSAVVAYGFARFKFRGKGILFSAMLLSMMLPAQVLMIPQYLWYQKLGWVGSFPSPDCPILLRDPGIFRIPAFQLHRRYSDRTGRSSKDRRLFLLGHLYKDHDPSDQTGSCNRLHLLLYVEMG